MEQDGSATCYLFDLIAVPPAEQAEMVAVLAALLQEEAVMKVVHDGRHDAEALHYQLKVILVNVLDTQVRSVRFRSEEMHHTARTSIRMNTASLLLHLLVVCI